MNLCVAFVGGTVLPLDLEKEVLHFPQRTVLYGGGEFFYNARDLWLAFVKQTANKLRAALCGEILAFRRDGCLEIPDGSIELLQPDRIRCLRAPQRIHLGMIQTRSKYDLVAVEPLGKVLFQFLRRSENPRPAFVLLFLSLDRASPGSGEAR